MEEENNHGDYCERVMTLRDTESVRGPDGLLFLFFVFFRFQITPDPCPYSHTASLALPPPASPSIRGT